MSVKEKRERVKELAAAWEKFKKLNNRGITKMLLDADLTPNEQQPDYYYNKDDWEHTYCDLESLEDVLDDSRARVMRVGRLFAMPDQYMVNAYNEEDDCNNYVLFDTLEEANQKLKEIKDEQNA